MTTRAQVDVSGCALALIQFERDVSRSSNLVSTRTDPRPTSSRCNRGAKPELRTTVLSTNLDQPDVCHKPSGDGERDARRWIAETGRDCITDHVEV
jgi:hypothetical protein